MARLQVDVSDSINTLKNLYEDLVTCNISRQKFHELKNEYNKAKKHQVIKMSGLSIKKTEQQIAEAEWEKANNVLDGFQKSKVLTHELIEGFIQQIGVFEDRQVYVEFRLI